MILIRNFYSSDYDESVIALRSQYIVKFVGIFCFS